MALRASETSAAMIEEGTIRGHLFTRGAWRDSIVHSILSDEYKA
jgi:ribosomal-protein-alanine N-acetyltransferase